jgi:predicted dinucleotide-binding enzyme
MKIAIVGGGNVGKTLGTGWSARHQVSYLSRSQPDDERRKLAGDADVLVVATPAAGAEAALKGLPVAGKVIVDCTNPLKADLSGLTLGTDTSAAERLAAANPSAKVVKAFNTIGFDIMANPRFGAHRAFLPVAGDDADAKRVVMGLGDELGFEAVDAGALDVARYMEPFAMLWITMAYKAGLGRDFAFAMVKR